MTAETRRDLWSSILDARINAASVTRHLGAALDLAGMAHQERETLVKVHAQASSLYRALEDLKARLEQAA